MSDNISEDTPRTPEIEVRAEMTLTKEDLVKIKYAEQEKALDEREDEVRKELEAEKKKLERAESALQKVLAKGTDDLPEDFTALSEALQSLGNETDGGSSRSLHKLGPDDTVTLTGGEELSGDEEGTGPFYVSERRMIAWRPPLKDTDHERPQYIEAYHDSIRRALTDEEDLAVAAVTELEDRVSELNEALVEVKKKISSLPKMLRQAEAAVANRVLQQTAEGRQMLASLNEVPNLLE